MNKEEKPIPIKFKEVEPTPLICLVWRRLYVWL